MTKQDKQTMNELLKRINSNISTYGNTKPHLGHDGIKQVMDFISTIRREAVESEQKSLLRVIKSLPLCNICGSGQTIERHLNSLEKGTNNGN